MEFCYVKSAKSKFLSLSFMPRGRPGNWVLLRIASYIGTLLQLAIQSHSWAFQKKVFLAPWISRTLKLRESCILALTTFYLSQRHNTSRYNLLDNK